MSTTTKIIIVLFSILFGGKIVSQSNNPYLSQNRLLIQSQDIKGTSFGASTEFSYMILNLATGEFLLRADLSTIKTGDTNLDSLIRIQSPQPLLFKGNVNENLYLFNQHVNDEKEYKLEGQLSINGTSVACIATYDPVNLGDKTEPRNYRMDFRLTIDPGKIAIFGLENKINNQLAFEIIDGTLNIQP